MKSRYLLCGSGLNSIFSFIAGQQTVCNCLCPTRSTESQRAPWMQGVHRVCKVCENLYLLSILQQEEFWSPCSIRFIQGDLHLVVHRGMQLLVLWCWSCVGASVSQGLQRSFVLISLCLLAIYGLGIMLNPRA